MNPDDYPSNLRWEPDDNGGSFHYGTWWSPSVLVASNGLPFRVLAADNEAGRELAEAVLRDALAHGTAVLDDGETPQYPDMSDDPEPEWARTPPAPLLEAVEQLHAIELAYRGVAQSETVTVRADAFEARAAATQRAHEIIVAAMREVWA
jgi:hypothetical protein